MYGSSCYNLHTDPKPTNETFLNEDDDWAVEAGYVRGAAKEQKKAPAPEKAPPPRITRSLKPSL
jgi:hypothetical protein